MNLATRMSGIGLLAALAACGGGTGQLSGTITGLTTAGLQLTDGTDNLTLGAGSTTFTFPTLLTDGTAYSVSVVTQPEGLFCTVANGSGTVSSSTPSANITVSCSASFNVSGTISNLLGSGLKISDGTETILVNAGARSFAFPTLLRGSDAFAITVTNPTGPAQIARSIRTSRSLVNGAPVSNIVITCK